MLIGLFSQDPTPTPSQILPQNETTIDTTKEVFASPHNKFPHIATHTTPRTVPCLTMTSCVKFGKNDFVIFRFSQWQIFCAACHMAQRQLPGKKDKTNGVKTQINQHSKNYFSICYFSPQPRVSSIGFNPWEFLKNIANVISDLNKTKKIC